MTTEIINGDALIELPKLAARGVVVDACITDPPYGTTACAWDAVIPFEPMWANLKRLVKASGAIVLFGSQPFTSALVMSNPRMFKYQWVWNKQKTANIFHASRQPMRVTEDLAVFSREGHTYNPQMTEALPEHIRPSGRPSRNGSAFPAASGFYKNRPDYDATARFPVNLISVSAAEGECNHVNRIHPNQKPVELMRYLVRTYTNPGDTVLDFTAGSFTTGVACVIEGRNFIGIEQNLDYCRIGEARIQRAKGIPATIPRLNRRQVETLPLFEGAA